MSSGMITEPAQSLPVDVVCDVAVVGGGIAGVAAALAAARQGVRVALIEKQFGLGGLATLGHVIMYLPLCDGYGRQVMAGLAEELIHLSVAGLQAALPAAGFLPVPECWKPGGDPGERGRKRFLTEFNPYEFQVHLERVVERAGIELLYDTRVCRVLKNRGEISHLVVENKSGRLAVSAEVFVDASGDADLCSYAGCPVEEFPYNVPAGWFYEIVDERMSLVRFTNMYDREHRGGGRAVGPFFSGTDHRDVTRHVLETRKLLLERLEKKRQARPEAAIHPFALPSIPDFRVTRRLRNRFSLAESYRHRWLEDCIGLTSDWRRRGPVYPLPLRAIQSDDCRNLFAVGRCMSSDHTVIDVTRAIGTCAVTGEAAGIASALLVKDRIADRHIPLHKLQGLLRKAGVLLDPELVKPHPRA